MVNAAPRAIAINNTLDDVLRKDRGRLMAALISRFGNFQTAEDALQDACISALVHWGRSGLPKVPTAWLMRVALNKGIDRIRASARAANQSDFLGMLQEEAEASIDADSIPDERLRLIFTCCHPALETKSRVALTLRTVCQLTTREIAHAFLDAETTMGQRLTRAKRKIQASGIAFAEPEPDRWPERLSTVLSTIYLIFTTGYVQEDAEERDLCQEGIFLMRLLDQLCPHEPEIEGALALMLLTTARHHARVGKDGASTPIKYQDRGLWDAKKQSEARGLLSRAMQRGRPGPFQIKAAIADCHMAEPEPDWPQMSMLYGSLWVHEPTPVVALNWAVVMSELGQVSLAAKTIDDLEPELSGYQPWHAVKADVYTKLGQYHVALCSLQKAISLAPNEADRRHLQKKEQNLLRATK